MNLKDTYNRIAKDWDEDHKVDTWSIDGTEKFANYLKPGDKILDVGCAGGLKSEFLINKGFDVTGIDFAENMIEIAKQKVPNGKFFVQDITKPLTINEKFDGIFLQAVLLHVYKKDVLKVLNNLVNLLNPKGYLYIAVKEIRPGQPEEMSVKENDYGYEYERFFSFYTFDELKNYISELNMSLIHSDTVPRGSTNWILVIAQK